MYCCEVCGFETGRLANFKRHKSRKKPCKKSGDVNPYVNLLSQNVNLLSQNVNLLSQNVNPDHQIVNPKVRSENTDPEQTNKPKYSCETCGKTFNTRQGKSKHKKNVDCQTTLICEPIVPERVTCDSTTCPYCEKVFSREDNLKRHMTSCAMKNFGGKTIYNTTNTNNTTTNNNNSHNNNSTNITINLNSYDNPSVDHVDMDVIKELYYKNGRNLKKLIHEGVRRIWEKRENNTFNLPFSSSKKIKKSLFQRNETLQVYSDGDHRMLPANHVVDVILQKAAAVCESHLRRHYYDDNVRGHAVLKHADVLEELAIEYQESWDEDKKFRDGYKPFVENALIECMLSADK